MVELYLLCVKLKFIILWIHAMFICIGGDLDGQVIEKEGRLLKASDIDPSFKTEYYKQIYNRDNVIYQFWLPVGSDLHEMSKLVLDILRAPKN